MKQYFQYGEKEIEYLKKKDKRLAAVIEQVGMIKREVNPDLFYSLIDSIVGQQISTKAHQTIRTRILTSLGSITPASINNLSLEELQQFGISFRKAEYIQIATQKVIDGEIDLNALQNLPDEEVIAELTKIKGVGVWTAEMLLLFSMQRPNILSFGDLAIQRGLRILYRHRHIDKKKHLRYWKRYTPYSSVASLYLWEVAGGEIVV